MLGNKGGNTCFCLHGNALWMYAIVPVKALVCGTELLLGVLRGQNSKKSSYFFLILGWEFQFISYVLATVIPIF